MQRTVPTLPPDQVERIRTMRSQEKANPGTTAYPRLLLRLRNLDGAPLHTRPTGTPSQRAVIQGIEGDSPWTLRELSTLLGVSRQIIMKDAKAAEAADLTEAPPLPDDLPTPLVHVTYTSIKTKLTMDDATIATMRELLHQTRTTAKAGPEAARARAASEALAKMVQEQRERGLAIGTIAKAIGSTRQTEAWRLATFGFMPAPPSRKMGSDR